MGHVPALGAAAAPVTVATAGVVAAAAAPPSLPSPAAALPTRHPGSLVLTGGDAGEG